MTLLYRTPNITIAGAEWHCTVERRYNSGRVRRFFRFRFPGQMWQPISAWKGHRPTALEFRKFLPFKRHMLQAGAE